MMYGWWDYGPSATWYGMIFGPIMMFALFVMAALMIASVLRALGVRWRTGVEGKSALEILNDRLARGEINGAEYEERKQLLSGS